MGVTLIEYRRELRIETAMRLILLADDLPLAEVGALVGYERWEAFRMRQSSGRVGFRKW